MSALPDPVALTQALIQRPSVTPENAGAIELVSDALAAHGFDCRRVDRNGIANLYAIRRDGPGPTFAFAGHTDVVPAGDAAAWRHDPFSGALDGPLVWGRGATDMKSAVAAFVSAACRHVAETPPAGAIALLITGDEEGDAVDGTRALLDWMAETGERVDHCVVGEPTSIAQLGDVMKVGRRGSLTATLRAVGRQGHAAYPHRAANPLPSLVRLLDRLAQTPLDDGDAVFEPSTLALTTIDVGNPANNVIPASATAQLNIRFNTQHRSDDLIAWLRREAEAAAETDITIEIETRVSGEAFVTETGPFTDLVAEAVAAQTGLRPKATTGGGTSDARFIKDHCPVVEFGLVGDTMHQVDERTSADDIRRLAEIYGEILRRYFAAPPLTGPDR